MLIPLGSEAGDDLRRLREIRRVILVRTCVYFALPNVERHVFCNATLVFVQISANFNMKMQIYYRQNIEAHLSSTTKRVSTYEKESDEKDAPADRAVAVAVAHL